MKSWVLALALVLGTALVADATPIAGPRGIAQFVADGTPRVLVAQTSGDIVETTYYGNGVIVDRRTIAGGFYGGIAAIGGYQTPDGWRHAIVGMTNGIVFDYRYRAGQPSSTTLFANVSAWGTLKSMAVWTDPQGRPTLTFLSRLGAGNAWCVYRAGETTFVNFFADNSAIDVAGHYQPWDGRHMASVAVGSPSRIDQISWAANTVPANFQVISWPPWATQFPSNQGPQTITSLSATAGLGWHEHYYSTHQMILGVDPWMKQLNVNNGGSTLFDDLRFAARVRAVSGPDYVNGGTSGVRRYAVALLDNGELWTVPSVVPAWGAPVPPAQRYWLGFY